MDNDFWKNTRIYPMNPRGMTASQVGHIRDIIWDVMHKNVTMDYLKVVPENEDAIIVVCTYKSSYVGGKQSRQLKTNTEDMHVGLNMHTRALDVHADHLNTLDDKIKFITGKLAQLQVDQNQLKTAAEANHKGQARVFKSMADTMQGHKDYIKRLSAN